MPRIEFPSAELNYRLDGSGVPVLLLHGAGGSSLIWYKQATELARYFTCVAMDQPGFGKSDWTGAPVEYSQTLCELIDHFGWSRIGIVGHSLGGWAAVRLALQRPHVVAGLVLSSSWAGLQVPEVLACIEARDERLAELRKSWRERRADSHLPFVGPRFRSAHPDLHWLAEGIAGLGREGSRMAWDPTYSAVMIPETKPTELDGWSVPTLCVAGSDDVYVPASAMREVTKALRDASFALIKESGHWTFLEQPERYNDTVVSFLRSQLSSADK